MIYNIKIGIPSYKICYSIIYVIFLSFIRRIAYIDEIGIALDPNIALLAIIFCADTYHQEVQSNRWEIFALYPLKGKYTNVLMRLCFQFIYLCLLTIISYWFFYLQKPRLLSNPNHYYIYVTAIFACTCSIIFFGTLSFTIINFLRNIWAGIGMSVVIWYIMNSTLSKNIPYYIDVFAYCNRDLNEKTGFWIVGKITFVILAILMILINSKLINERMLGIDNGNRNSKCNSKI